MSTERIEVDSSFIKAVSLCEQSRVFAFEFKDEIIFYEVSNPRINLASLLKAFLKAKSKGVFFNKVFIKNKRILKGLSEKSL